VKHFNAVIFDLDGLLLDTETIALSAFLKTCSYFGLPAQQELFIRCIGTNQARGREVLAEGLRGQVDHLLFEEVWDRHYDERTTNERIALKDGAAELLAHISSLRLPVAVATSTGTPSARAKLRGAGILDRFQVTVGGDQVGNSKPAPDVYLKAAEMLRVSPGACLALEDSENGVRAALAARMTVVQIPDLVPPTEALRSLSHIVLRSLRDVATYPFVPDAQANSSSSGRATSARRST
jgi:HAD superfamily hydrolase (TIGR01509 family)